MTFLPLWAKWLALHCVDYPEEMRRIESLRPRKNWAILIADDELACIYQRMRFRLERARYACGHRALIGEGSVQVVDGQLAVVWENATAIAEHNRKNFDRNHRQRAVKAKQIMADKHHPREAFETFLHARDLERYA
jgi:hypothetical protein